MAKVAKDVVGALFPTPVVMATTVDEDDGSNIITLAWVGVVSSKPFTISVALRPSRHSHALLTKSSELVINVPTGDLVSKTDYCGCISGRDVDKFETTGFTATAGQFVKAPMIAECPINLECAVIETLSLGAHDLFISKVLQVHVDEELLDDSGKIDFARLAPFAFIGLDYWALGKKIGHYGFSKGQLP
ncbi:MAG: flavin reductase family protein [Actinomycetia bacterium]|nr:flavin reductase family protein [Actinomycetes bacterium]